MRIIVSGFRQSWIPGVWTHPPWPKTITRIVHWHLCTKQTRGDIMSNRQLKCIIYQTTQNRVNRSHYKLQLLFSFSFSGLSLSWLAILIPWWLCLFMTPWDLKLLCSSLIEVMRTACLLSSLEVLVRAALAVTPADL